jgi:predicted Zn finger-like uncharacterized protein
MTRATFQCPHCHQKFASRSAVVGKSVRCLKCGASFLAGVVQPPPAPLPPDPPPNQQRTEKRVIAACIAALFPGGLVACYFGIWGPLEQMHRQVPEVKYSSTGFISGPLLLLIGLGLSVVFLIRAKFPAIAERFTGEFTRRHRLLLALVVVGFVFGVDHWWEQKVRDLGYKRGIFVPPATARAAPSPVNFTPPPQWKPPGTGVSETILKDLERKLKAHEPPRARSPRTGATPAERLSRE